MTLHVGPTEDIAACVRLRRAVFIEEQGVPEDVEQDGRDGAAHHVLAMLDGVPVGWVTPPHAVDRESSSTFCVDPAPFDCISRRP